MTEDETAAEAARLLTEYSALTRKRTCLMSKIRTDAEPIGILATHLRELPLRVTVRDGAFLVNRQSDEVTVAPDFAALAALVDTLHETEARLANVSELLANTEHAHMVTDR